MQATYGRRAVRTYSTEPVTNDQITALIDAAIQAPSAMNLQPWSFCVVRDQDLLGRVSNQSKSFVLRNPPGGSFAEHLRLALTSDEFDIFYHAPVLIVISAVDAGTWGAIDCALAAQNLMLAAHAMGLASCWIGFAEGWLTTDEGKAAIKLPVDHTPVAPVIIGHPRGAVPAVERNAPPVTWIG
jgi:nitroreductase